MLVLTRKNGEGVIMSWGDTTIEITLTALSPSQTKIGITAPEEVVIWRKELGGFNSSKRKVNSIGNK